MNRVSDGATCPKCGFSTYGKWHSGPTFCKDACGRETLSFHCTRCGYSLQESTHDEEVQDDAIV